MQKETFHFVYHRDDEQKRPEGYTSGGMGVYLHGTLEKEAGYDIAWMSNDFMSVPDGVYPATYNGKEGATLFLSRRSFSEGHVQLRGLVVWNNDPEFKDTEQEFLDERSFFKPHEYKRTKIL